VGPSTVIPAKAGISCRNAGKEPHEIPAFAGMTALGINRLPPRMPLGYARPTFGGKTAIRGEG